MDPAAIDYSLIRSFLRSANWPRFAEWQPTFFSIAGIAHKELPLSNTYAFFFRSQNPHGLGKLFTLALLDIVRSKLPSTQVLTFDREVRASREHPMKLGQWLDLLVHDGPTDTSLQGASFALLIENKVNHRLHNNLENYWDSVKGVACKIGVVLGTRPEQPETPWLFIPHWELGRAIEARLGHFIGQANPRYLPVLLHFLEHLTHMSDSNHSNFALAFDFAQRHREALRQSQLLLKQINSNGMAAAVLEAFGEGYTRLSVFDNRVDIRSGSFPRSDVYYVVYYGHILDFEQKPTFAITLYCGSTDAATLTSYTTQLAKLPLATQTQLERLEWFDAHHLIGKRYTFDGTSLEEFRNEVQEVLKKDWQNVEAAFALQVKSAAPVA